MTPYLFFQTEIPIPPADKVGFMLWGIGIMVIAVITLFTFWNKAIKKLTEVYESQLSDRDETVRIERESRLKLEAQIAPALASIAETQKEILKYLRDGK